MEIVIRCHKPYLPRVKVVAVLVTVVSDCGGVNSGDSRLKFPGLDTVTKATFTEYVTKASDYGIKHCIMVYCRF
jgi:hypothetical protein